MRNLSTRLIDDRTDRLGHGRLKNGSQPLPWVSVVHRAN